MNELQAREQGFSGRRLEDALTQRLRSGILVLPRESDGDGRRNPTDQLAH